MKNIYDYDFPAELKSMSLQELDLLALQIREFLIDKVSRTGGHLASNLGIVELTIAIHRIFDSPEDKIIWDVGHQAYVHKILTGRAGDFDTLRQYGGLSGFPKTRESVHDCYDTGHSSTSISAACGMAQARDLKGDDYSIVAVIGDGSLTGGEAFEGLNNAGSSKSGLIVILNDNGMSISTNVGSLSKHLATLRTSKAYLETKKFVKSKVSGSLASGLSGLKKDIKYSLLESGGVLFEELGFTYLGPFDGHDIETVSDALRIAKSLEGPVLVHVITKKGKGYRNAELNPGKYHGIGAFDPETGMLRAHSSKPGYSACMGSHLTELAGNDPRIVAVTAAMTDGTGLMPFKSRYPKRIFDVGIAEEHAVSFAAGMAAQGMRPFVCIYSSFLQRAYDQLIEDICLQKLPVTFMIDRAGVVGDDGETHHGVFDLSYLLALPGMTVCTPCTKEDLLEAMDGALHSDGPVAIRFPRGEALDKTEYENDDSGVQILAVGKMFGIAQKAAEIARLKGRKVILTPVNRIKPFDMSLINPNAEKIVTIEDNVITGGFGQYFNTLVKDLGIRTENYAWPDEFIPQGKVDILMEKYGLSPELIANTLLETEDR